MKIKITISGLILVLFAAGCSNMLSNNPNSAPLAIVAQSSITDLYPGVEVTLDGGESLDVDDQDLSYLWTIEAGTNGSLTGTTTTTPVFSSDEEDSYTVRLTVSDEYDVSDTADVTIDVINNAPAPTALFSPATPIADDEAMTLTGTNMDDDPDRGAVCTYAWAISDRPNPSSAAPSGAGTMTDDDGDLSTGNESDGDGSITLDAPGVYVVRLTTTDEWSKSGSDTATIATDSNTAPMAGVITLTGVNYGGDGSSATPFLIDEAVNYTIELNSTDTQNDTLDYIWKVNNFTGFAVDLPLGIDNNTATDRSSGDTVKTSNTPIGGDSSFYDEIVFSVSSSTDINSNDSFSISADITDGAETITETIYFEIN